MNPSTSLAPGRVREIREQFVDLVCADPDLMRAEFDAIIEAAWGGDESPPQTGQAQDTHEPAKTRRGPFRPDNLGHRPASPDDCATSDSLRRRPRSPPGRTTRAERIARSASIGPREPVHNPGGQSLAGLVART